MSRQIGAHQRTRADGFVLLCWEVCWEVCWVLRTARLTSPPVPNLLSSQIYEWSAREGLGVFARLMIRAITAAISSMIAVPATKTVTKAMSKAVFA